MRIQPLRGWCALSSNARDILRMASDNSLSINNYLFIFINCDYQPIMNYRLVPTLRLISHINNLFRPF